MYRASTLFGCCFAAAYAIAAGSAFAAVPEFVNEKGEVPKGAVIGTAKATTLFSKTDKAHITCEANHVVLLSGSFTGVKTIGLALEYEKCKGENKKGAPCEVHTPGAAAEVIETAALVGELGPVGKAEAASEVGLAFRPKAGATFTKLEGTCLPANPASVEGAFICEVSQVARFLKESDIICATTTETQKIKMFVRGEETALKVFGTAGALEGTEELEFAENVKVT